MHVTLDVPDELSQNFQSIEVLKRTIYEDFVIEQRQQGTISLSKAAALLNITYAEFFALLSAKGLSFINATPQETDASYADFQAFMSEQQL